MSVWENYFIVIGWEWTNFSVIFIQSDNKWVIVWKLEKWSIHTTRAIWKFFQIVLALKVRAILREFQTSLVV